MAYLASLDNVDYLTVALSFEPYRKYIIFGVDIKNAATGENNIGISKPFLCGQDVEQLERRISDYRFVEHDRLADLLGSSILFSMSPSLLDAVNSILPPYGYKIIKPVESAGEQMKIRNAASKVRTTAKRS